MSILSVDTISPIGSGTSVTVNSAATLVLTNANSTGVVTATSFVGSGANLTSLPAANLTGTLPAISGANLTGVLSNIVEDTSPQLGADLDCNQKGILLQDRNSGNQGAVKWGDNGEMWMFHAGSDNTNRIYSSGKEWAIWSGASNDHACLKVTASDTDPAIELYYNNSKKLSTKSSGVGISGILEFEGGSGAYSTNSNSTWQTLFTFSNANNNGFSMECAVAENNYSTIYKVGGTAMWNSCYFTSDHAGDSNHAHSSDIEFRVLNDSGTKRLQFKAVSYTTTRYLTVISLWVKSGSVTWS